MINPRIHSNNPTLSQKKLYKMNKMVQQSHKRQNKTFPENYKFEKELETKEQLQTKSRQVKSV